MSKYMEVEGRHNIDAAFRKGKGVILLGMHAGSWELSNTICARLGFPFVLLVRDQKMPRVNNLLNTYRKEKGCRLIQRENLARGLIEALKNNEAIGMTADQGGKTGELVKFFGKSASMATGAIRLALRYDAVILPAYYRRINGPYHKLIIEPPFEVHKMADKDLEIKDNLQRLMPVYEKNIRLYPAEYLWTYKIWKYGVDRDILILSDGKAGHLRQSQTVAEIAKNYLAEKGLNASLETVEVKIKHKFSLTHLSILSGRYSCQGCLGCLRRFLEPQTYDTLMKKNPDVIISSGASLAAINFLLSRENQAKSIVLMRPSILSTRRFDLVIMPRHDDPPRRKNICVTLGAMNLINAQYLAEQSADLLQVKLNKLQAKGFYLGLLIGGDAKGFIFKEKDLLEAIKQVKLAAERLNAEILVTTSRRTTPRLEDLVKKEFTNYSRCKLLVIANEKNLASAAGGILGLSSIIVTSPESISMISEAISSQKYVFTFNPGGLSRRHNKFIHSLVGNKYLYLAELNNLSNDIESVWQVKPEIKQLKDNFLVRKAIEKIL